MTQNIDHTQILFNDTNIFTNELDDKIDDTAKIDDEKIIIFSDGTGKRKNTYIVKWPISKEDMKPHLKKLKIQLACSGSIKTITYDSKDELVIHLQGYHVHALNRYLSSLNIQNILLKTLE